MIAYLVLAHRDNEQLRSLLVTLASDHRSAIYLHLDARIGTPDWITGGDLQGRIQLVPPLVVHWAGYSMVEATLRLLQQALADERNMYFVLLSGTCFPIRPMALVNNLLSRPNMPSCLALWKIVFGHGATPRPEERQAVAKSHWLDVGFLNPARGTVRRVVWRLMEAINTMVPYSRAIGDTIVKGSQWFGADRRLAAEFVRQSRSLQPLFRRSFAPDEMLFQTIYYHDRKNATESPVFVDELDANQALHFITFRMPPPGSLSLLQRARFTFDPRLLDVADLDQVVASDALFARKCTPALVDALSAKNRAANHPAR